ncbi:MAG: recombination mediator RecR [Pseudomonadota bacterium]
MKKTTLLDELITAFKYLPGVGEKTAQRMAYYTLERARDGGKNLAMLLSQATESIGYCKVCRNLTEKDLCYVCSDKARDVDQVCVVETPADIIAIESSTSYKGRYYVLMGRLSPLDGIGPKEIGLDFLEEQFKKGTIKEVILATNSTTEGEVTAHVIRELTKKYKIQTTRLAQGVPVGGELEYVDSSTLSQAFSSRQSY